MKLIERKGSYRWKYIFYVLMMVLLGLSSRRYSLLLPTFVADHVGAVFWAMMVYFGFRFFFLKKSILFAGICSILFSFGIEFSQLYQATWISELRNTMIGALILGRGLVFIDLVRYLVGIGIAGTVDVLWILRKKRLTRMVMYFVIGTFTL